MTRTTLIISEQSAKKLCHVLTRKLGTPEGGSPASFMGRTEYEHSWRYRLDDGTALARLGYGPTRKMVTLQTITTAVSTIHRLFIRQS
jgi:hypothetical protein